MRILSLFLSATQLFIVATTFAQPGTLDLTFDGDGKQTSDFQLYSRAAVKASTVQADGKILVTGYIESELLDLSGFPYTSVIVSRYNTDGTPDNNFGSGGSVITRAGNMSDGACAITVQTDGKIVVAGYTTGVSGFTNILVIRYTINGIIDNTFGVNGKAITDIAADYEDAALAVKMQKDGKIIVGGYSNFHHDWGGYSVLARYNTNGSIDNTFGAMGIVLDFQFICQINALTIQQDNKILTAGYGPSLSLQSPHVLLKRYNINGSLDITFGSNGYAFLDVPQESWDEAVSIVVQPDKKIVICGNSHDFSTYSDYYFFVARFNLNGSLDNSFGSQGIIVKQTDFYERGIAALVQNDGKIVMVTSEFNSWRFNADGTTDNTFGTNGIAHADVGISGYEETYSAVMQSDNKVIASGYAVNLRNESQRSLQSYGFAISRLNTTGAADNAFGSSGIVKTDFKTSNTSTDYGQSVVIGQGGKIIIGGYSYAGALLNQSLLSDNADGSPDEDFNSNGKLTKNYGGNFQGFSLAVQADGNLVFAGKWHNGSNYDFAVTRYVNGNPDFYAFGSGGIAHVATGGSDESAYAVTMQTDGKIVLAGTSYNGHDYDIALARFNSNGTIDNTFSFDGVLMKNISNGNDYAYSVAVQPDKKIVVGGYGYNGTNDDFIVLRFLEDGSADNSFGTGGVVKTGITRTSNDYGRALKIQADGKIILAGYSSSGTNSDYVILRYNSNGTLDNTFNTTGFVTGSFDVTSNDFCTSVAIQADGRIVMAGYYYKNATNKNDFALARFMSNGKPDASFGTGGKVLTDFGGTDDYANAITLQQDGKIIVAGTSANDFAIARYNNAGSAILSGINNTASSEPLKSVPNHFIITPNPVSQSAFISFYNSEKRHIQIELFDAQGRKAKTIGVMDDIGMRTFSFSKEGLKVGIYFLRVKARNWSEVKEVVIE